MRSGSMNGTNLTSYEARRQTLTIRRLEGIVSGVLGGSIPLVSLKSYSAISVVEGQPCVTCFNSKRSHLFTSVGTISSLVWEMKLEVHIILNFSTRQ